MRYKHNSELVPLAKNLRKNMTKEERHLWHDFLKKYPYRFLRQKVIGRFIVDFYCASAKLVIELDGSQHFEKNGLEKDKERTACLQGYGLKIIRFSNHEIKANFSGVCKTIDLAVKTALLSDADFTAAPNRR